MAVINGERDAPGARVSADDNWTQSPSIQASIRMFRASAAGTPWICPGCQTKTLSQIQNGINRELLPERQCEPRSRASIGNYNSTRSSRAQKQRRKPHPAVSHSHIRPPALMGWSEGLDGGCFNPAGRPGAEAKSAASTKEMKLLLWHIKMNWGESFHQK